MSGRLSLYSKLVNIGMRLHYRQDQMHCRLLKMDCILVQSVFSIKMDALNDTGTVMWSVPLVGLLRREQQL